MAENCVRGKSPIIKASSRGRSYLMLAELRDFRYDKLNGQLRIDRIEEWLCGMMLMAQTRIFTQNQIPTFDSYCSAM